MFRSINWHRCRFYGVVAGFLFTLALFSLAWTFSTFPGDERTILWMEGLHTGWLNTVALAVTNVGSFPTSAILVFGVVTLLFLNRRRVDALVVMLTLAPMVSVFFLKLLVDRSRPEFFLVGSEPASMSFPSGHSVFAVLLGGILIFLVGELFESRPIRRSLQAGLGLLILGVGISRVYLGVHWPSDIIGGYLFGGLSLLGLVWLRSQLLTGAPTAQVPA